MQIASLLFATLELITREQDVITSLMTYYISHALPSHWMTGGIFQTGLSISFEVASRLWKVGVSLLSERGRREPPRGVWGHAPPENFEI